MISKYQSYFNTHYPPKGVKSAWYRFYFFKNSKHNQKIRERIIKNLKKNNLRCFTGSCPEIYLEKSFKKLKGFKQKRLKIVKFWEKQVLHWILIIQLNTIFIKNLLILENVIKKELKLKLNLYLTK